MIFGHYLKKITCFLGKIPKKKTKDTLSQDQNLIQKGLLKTYLLPQFKIFLMATSEQRQYVNPLLPSEEIFDK